MKKITITKANGQVGVLTLANDGRYDVILNGHTGAVYYTADQVNKIVATSRAAGDKVEIEK